MQIDQALAGEAGLAGVQWVLYGAPMRGILHEALTALLAPPAMVCDCRLLRAKVKPGRKLTAYYAITLAGLAPELTPTRAIAVTWTLPKARLAPPSAVLTAPPAVVVMEAAAHNYGVAAPFRQLWGANPAVYMEIEVAPLDVTFPQLVRAATPAHVTAMLAAYMDRGAASPSDPALPGYRVTTIRYRPRQRHVLRYDPITPPVAGGNGCFFAKLYQGEEGEQSWQVMEWLADQLVAQPCGVQALRPTACVRTDQLLLYPYAHGTPLSQLLMANRAELGWLHSAGAALRTLHAATPPLFPAVPHKDFAGEVKATWQAGEQLAALAPDLHAELRSLLDQALASYAALAPADPVFTHSDFKADHLLVTEAGLTLIDFDSCAFADPAADLGKFWADLVWWQTQGGQFDLSAVQNAFLAGYGLSADQELLSRAHLYATLSLAKNTVRRFNLFDDQWLAHSREMLGRAATFFEAIGGKQVNR